MECWSFFAFLDFFEIQRVQGKHVKVIETYLLFIKYKYSGYTLFYYKKHIIFLKITNLIKLPTIFFNIKNTNLSLKCKLYKTIF